MTAATASAEDLTSGNSRGSLGAIPRDYNFAADILEMNFKAGRANKPVYLDARGSWTYGQLAERVEKFGQALRALGIRREQRVLMAMTDTIDWPTAFLGCLKAGVIAIPVNTLMTESDYEYMLADSRACALIVSEALYPRFEKLIGKAPDLEHVIVSGDDVHGHKRFEDLIEKAKGAPYTAPTTRDDMAFWLYTSGSTGKPKGAVHIHGSLKLTADLYGTPVAGLKESDLVYSVAKLFFAYGLGNAMTFPMSVGATTVLLADRPTPDGVAALLKKYPITVFWGVPTFYGAFINSPNAPQKSEVRLRRCLSAGEALPEEIAKRFKERYGVEICDGLGTTEMLHIYLTNVPGAHKYGTTGKPVPGYDIKLVGEDGQTGQEGRDGRDVLPRPDQRDHVLEQPGEIGFDLPGRVDAVGRQVHRGRGRLLRLLRSRRRHVEGVGALCLTVRGRGGAAVAPRRLGSRGGRLERRAEADQAEGFRRAQIAGQGERCAGARIAGSRQGETGAIQISALDRISKGLAENRDGQDPALQVAHGSPAVTLDDAGFVDIGPQRLEYRMIGPRPGEAPTLVMLHEGLGCVGLWGDFPDKLQQAAGCGVFVYSRAGYGQSSPVKLPRPLTYMHDEARDTLPQLLDVIGFRRGLLIGHSDGASIATIYAGTHQDHRVQGLVLIAPHFFTEDAGIASIVEAKQAYETTDLQAKLARWHNDPDNAFKGWNGAWLDPNFRRWDITEQLAYIRVPMLIVQGEADQYGTVAQIEAAQRNCYCPVEVALLPGAKHSPQREAPEATLAAISGFVDHVLREAAQHASA